MESMLTVGLYTVLVPGGAAALMALVMRYLKADGAARGVAAALGVSVGPVLAQVGIAGMPPIPPIDSMGWIPMVTLGTMLLLVPWEGSPRLRVIGWIVTALAAAVGAYFVGKPTFAPASLGVVALGLGVVGVGSAVVVGVMESAKDRMPLWAVFGALLVAVTAASIGSVLSETALFAMLLGSVAAAVGGLTVGGLVLKSLAWSRAAVGVLVVTAAMMLLYVKLYAGMPTLGVALLGAAFVAPGLAALMPGSPKSRAAVALVVALALGAAGAWFSQKKPVGGAGGGDDYVGMLVR